MLLLTSSHPLVQQECWCHAHQLSQPRTMLITNRLSMLRDDVDICHLAGFVKSVRKFFLFEIISASQTIKTMFFVHKVANSNDTVNPNVEKIHPFLSTRAHWSSHCCTVYFHTHHYLHMHHYIRISIFNSYVISN
jgi:hypothetical protein